MSEWWDDPRNTGGGGPNEDPREAHIRELETQLKLTENRLKEQADHFRGAMEHVEWERVSEAEWNRLHALLETDREQLALFKNHNLELQKRIAKAKAILEQLFAHETEAIPRVDYSVPKMVERALAALEGK